MQSDEGGSDKAEFAYISRESKIFSIMKTRNSIFTIPLLILGLAPMVTCYSREEKRTLVNQKLAVSLIHEMTKSMKQ
jgi:hypothetical protein